MDCNTINEIRFAQGVAMMAALWAVVMMVWG